MLYLVTSTPRPEPPSDAVRRQQAFWDWFGPLRDRGIVRHAYARIPRGLVAVFDVDSHEALHALLSQWAEHVPATFAVEPLLDPAFKERSVRAAAASSD
jgi:muconolactone delta-isomerase